MSLSFQENFYYSQGSLHCDGVSIQTLAQKFPTPFYCYSQRHIQAQYQKLSDYFGGNGRLIAYAVKANSNPTLLKILAKMGCGADVVSGGELKLARSCEITPDKIVFAGVGKKRDEIALALTEGIFAFNVESEAELIQIAQIASDMGKIAPISLRVNPDIHAETLKGISTGKKGDKFGIAWHAIEGIFKTYSSHPALSLHGLDVHIGSQILNNQEFKQAFQKITSLVHTLRTQGFTITHLDLGGGFGVPYHAGQKPWDIQEYFEIVEENITPLNVKMVIEPGRFLMANAGILVSEVLYTKTDEDWECVIVDAGMNDLMRPALYDAWHEIYPIQEANITDKISHKDVVGPVCESTDCFAKARLLPPLSAGQKIAFMTAGAYGAVMGNTYNMRPLIAEILVDNHQAIHLIRPSIPAHELYSTE